MTKHVTVTMDGRLYAHIQAIAKVQGIIEGRQIGMAEMFRTAAKDHYAYTDFTVSVDDNSQVVKDIRRQQS